MSSSLMKYLVSSGIQQPFDGQQEHESVDVMEVKVLGGGF
jgi:hypothetical protein